MKILGECPACAEPVTDQEPIRVGGREFGKSADTGDEFWHLDCWQAHCLVKYKVDYSDFLP